MDAVRFIGKATPIVHSLWDYDAGVRAGRNYYSSSILQGRSCKDCGGCLCAICNVRYPSRTGIQRLRREGMFDRTVQDGFIGLVAPARLSVVRPSSQSVQKGCAGVIKFLDAQSLKAITCVERTKASWPARGYVVPYESYCLSVILLIGLSSLRRDLIRSGVHSRYCLWWWGIWSLSVTKAPGLLTHTVGGDPFAPVEDLYE